MDELKVLIGMVAGLPGLAIWVLVAFYAYKVVVIGSIYGLVRFIVARVADLVTTRRLAFDITEEVNGLLISNCRGRLISLLWQVRSGSGIDSNFVHPRDMDRLEQAWLEFRAREGGIK